MDYMQTGDAALLGASISGMMSWINVRFSVSGVEIENSKAFSPDGILPIFCQMADTVARDAGMPSLGFVYKQSGEALLGIEVGMNEASRPYSEILMYVLDAVTTFAMNNIPAPGLPVSMDGAIESAIDLAKERKEPA